MVRRGSSGLSAVAEAVCLPGSCGLSTVTEIGLSTVAAAVYPPSQQRFVRRDSCGQLGGRPAVRAVYCTLCNVLDGNRTEAMKQLHFVHFFSMNMEIPGSGKCPYDACCRTGMIWKKRMKSLSDGIQTPACGASPREFVVESWPGVSFLPPPGRRFRFIPGAGDLSHCAAPPFAPGRTETCADRHTANGYAIMMHQNLPCRMINRR